MNTSSEKKEELVYGAFEIKKLYPRNYSIGIAIAVILHLLTLGSYYVSEAFGSKDDFDNVPVVKIIKYSELGPPPSVANDIPQQIAVAGPVAPPTVGVPVPVPDAEAPPEQTIATQQEMSAQTSPVLGDGLGTGQVQITQDIKIEEPKDEDPDINTFVPVEKFPEIVYAPTPEYPEIARRAGITGKVLVKILVDKEGKPKKAVIFKSDTDMFNESAIAAAMKSAFTPAIQDNKPVPVWIVIPYKFTLQQ